MQMAAHGLPLGRVQPEAFGDVVAFLFRGAQHEPGRGVLQDRLGKVIEQLAAQGQLNPVLAGLQRIGFQLSQGGLSAAFQAVHLVQAQPLVVGTQFGDPPALVGPIAFRPIPRDDSCR